MLRFLRKIRLRLINQASSDKVRKSLIGTASASKPSSPAGKYFLYALGEIVLIVIGILIALQINNWNVNKAAKADFELILNEIESNIQFDISELSFETSRLGDQIVRLNRFLNSKDELEKDSLEIFLNLMIDNSILNFQTTGVDQLRNTEIIHSVSPLLIEWINTYYGFIDSPETNMHSIADFRKYLIENDLPPPPLTERDVSLYEKALQNENVQIYFRHLIDIKNSQLRDWKFYLENGQFCLHQIQNRERLSYGVAIRGSATQKGWESDILLEFKGNGKWEKSIKLVDGLLKFKLADTWIHNWGGSGFPDGIASLYGPDIPINAGFYHLTFDIENKTYVFKLIKEE